MRNLHVIGDRKDELQVPVELGDVVKFAVDSDGGLLFIAGTGLGVAAYRTATCEFLWFLDLRERLDGASGAPPLPPDTTIAAFDHVPELDSLCLALSSGELLLLDTSCTATSSTNQPNAGAGRPAAVEEVGAVDGGLAAAAWSPDGELLVLVTGTGSLLMMNKEWELLSESPLAQHKEQPTPAIAAAAAVVADRAAAAGAAAQDGSVGGAAQAQGAAEQQLRLVPGSVAVSWRGDGRYFATASLETPGATAAVLRVWDRETGELHAEAEAASGLLPIIAWQPNGRHLYAAVAKPVVQQPEGQAAAQAAASQQQRDSVSQQQQQQQQQLQHKYQQVQPHEAEQARQAAAEGIQHVGAWKRELRRRQAQRQATAAGGAVVDGSARNGSTASVLLFERNGLQHGGFELPPFSTSSAAAGAVACIDSEATIEQLAWSPDSEFLAVVLAAEDEEGLPQQVLQLWHRSNWHWYLKAERRARCCSALRCAWDAATPLCLHVMSAEGCYEQHQFTRQPSVSARGTAAVVDGASLLLTPLRHTVVPPPMCAATAIMPAPISCLAIRVCTEDEAIAAVLSDGRLALLTSVEEDLWEETLQEQLEARPWDGPGQPKLLPQLLSLKSATLEAAGGGGGTVRAAAWVDAQRLLLLVVCISGSNGSGGGGLLVELTIDAAAGTARETAAVSSGVPPLLTCCSLPANGGDGSMGGGVLLQQPNGALLKYSAGGDLQPLPTAAAFPTGCPQMAALPAAACLAAGGIGGDVAAAPAVGLSGRGQLHWGGRLLAADVTSFALRHSGPGGACLLYTTRQHTLHTLPLANPGAITTATAAALPQPQPFAGTAAGGLQQQQQQQFDVSAGPPQQHPQQQQSFRAAMKAAMRPAGMAGCGGGAADVTVRNIEQHGMLVAVPPGGVQAVLQMPRGNLEAVCPRALVLPALAAALDQGDFAGAWELATTNRLDLNVLVDYRWPRFLSQAPSFVEQVPGDQDLADLLSALSDQSTAAPGGLYAAALPALPLEDGGPTSGADVTLAGAEASGNLPAASQPGQGSKAAAATGGKVAATCAAVQAALEQRDKARYLRAILTGHAKCGQLEAALALIKAAKEEQLQGLREVEGVPSAEDGLRHLLLFILDDTLYRTALGMYELELAYMVVAHSQKDPGEYLLELQGFAAVADPHLRRHKIDMHLRRWDHALRHLVAAGESHFEAALELARDKGLLRLLLQLCEGDAERQRQVHAAYGEVLEGKNMQEDAGLAYIAAGQLDDAVRAYRAAGQWRMCFALASKAGWPADRRSRLAADLADELATAGRAADAAAVTLQYLRNVDSAVLFLAHGKEWREALRVSYDNGRQDLVDTVVAPRAAQEAAAALEEIGENIDRVHKYGARLKQLRQRRTDMEAALAAADAESGLPSRQQQLEDWDESVSVADSLVSGLSIYTDNTHTGATTVTASSITASTLGGKRRQKRNSKGKGKSSRIRQGSPQEEQQLAEHLLGLAPTAATCAEVGQLAELLVLLGHPSDAALLQQRLSALVQAQAAAAANILAYPPPALALALPRQQQRALEVVAGPAAAAAVGSILAGLPGTALQQRVAAAEAGVRESHWKWDVLREPPSMPAVAAEQGGSTT